MKLESLQKLLEKEYSVYMYETASGRKPVADYLKDLTSKELIRIFIVFEALAINGPSLALPHSRPLRENLFELRCKTQKGNERVIYCFMKGKNCILLHSFLKKTDKAPNSEVTIALDRYKDLLNRIE